MKPSYREAAAFYIVDQMIIYLFFDMSTVVRDFVCLNQLYCRMLRAAMTIMVTFIYEIKFLLKCSKQYQMHLTIIYWYPVIIIAWWETLNSLPLFNNITYIFLKIFQQWYCWAYIKLRNCNMLFINKWISYIILYKFIALKWVIVTPV